MRCPYCSAENRDGSTFCIFCGHALAAPSARTPATPNYAFPHPGRAPNARMVGKGQFTLKSGIPLPSGMSGAPPQAPPANAATVAPDTVAPAAETAAPASSASAEAEAARIAPDPMLGNGRRAPYFDPAAFDALAHPPNWRELGPARGSKAAHLILLLCMFGVGLLSGAAVLWWLNHPGEIQQALNDLRTDLGLQAQARVTAAQPTLSEKMPPPELTVTPPEAKAPAPSEAPAISAGELPYDGQAPAAGSVSAPDNSVSAPAPALATPAAPPPAAVPAPDTAAGENPAAPAPAREAKRADPAPVAASGAAEAKPPQKAQAIPIPEASRARAAKPPKKRAGDSGGSMRGDTTTASVPATPPRGTVAGERSLTPLMIAQCESMSNPKERAQCKLEVCRGKGGKNACPS